VKGSIPFEPPPPQILGEKKKGDFGKISGEIKKKIE